jgi:YbgC/YbaW family acyl-CoA thioester hydrolase
MARIKLVLPENISFKIQIPVRISDLNYGNHLANHVYLEYMQEARMQYFAQWNWSEKNLAGVGVIMGDVAVVYKAECFYGDVLSIAVTAAEFGARSFDLYYKMVNQQDVLVCEAKTGIVCFDYSKRETVAVPSEFIALASLN